MSRVLWWYSSENLSPLITAEYLALEQEIQMPGQYAREHQNSWIERADSFAGQADVDAAMGTGWVEALWSCPEPGHAIAVDLGAVHDPTVIGAAHTKDGVIYICRLITMAGSREQPVRMAAVKETIRALHASRQTVTTKIESWQGIAIAQDLQQELPGVELFVPTAKAHAEEWPQLAQRLSTRTIILPRHARLREELLNLSYEVGPMGVKVTDRGQVHQDHATVVRMLVAALAREPGLQLWFLRSDHGGHSFAPPAVSHEAERRQAADDARTAQEVARAEKLDRDRQTMAAQAACRTQSEADIEAEIEHQKELDRRDAERLMRDGSHWNSWGG